ELQHRDALELVDPLLGACCHSSILLGGIRIGRFGLGLSRSARLVVVCVLRLLVRLNLLPAGRRLGDLPTRLLRLLARGLTRLLRRLRVGLLALAVAQSLVRLPRRLAP